MHFSIITNYIILHATDNLLKYNNLESLIVADSTSVLTTIFPHATRHFS